MNYYSREWVNEVQKRINADAEFQKRVAALNFKIQNLLTDCPGGVDRLVTWDWSQGKVTSATVEEKPAPSNWRKTAWDEKDSFMRAVAPYDAFVKVRLGQMTPIEAMMKGVYRVDGDMSQVMPLMMVITTFVDFMRAVPAEV